MIYNDQFVWLHFPKCAGSKIENIFIKYFSGQKNLIQDPVGPKNDPSISWHDAIHDREKRDPKFRLGARTVICSFRRLPSWLESRYNYEYQRSPNLNHNPELLLEGKFLERNGYENHADWYVKNYLPEQILKSGNIKYLRTEYFEEDFKTIFSKFLDIPKIPDWEFKKKINKSRGYLPKSIKKQLYDNKKKIYEKCPYWCLAEEMAYKYYRYPADPPNVSAAAVKCSQFFRRAFRRLF